MIDDLIWTLYEYESHTFGYIGFLGWLALRVSYGSARPGSRLALLFDKPP